MYIDTRYTYVIEFKKESNVNDTIKEQDLKAEMYWNSVMAKATKPTPVSRSGFTAKLERINMNGKYDSADVKYKKCTKE